MARTRSLKPSFFDHDGIGDLPRDARLAFQALWCLADRDGRLLDRPRKIRGFAFRFDDDVTDEMVDEWLQILHDHRDRFITRYDVDGRRIIQVNGFQEHQSPHPREASDDLPPPPRGVPRETPGNFEESPEISRLAQKRLEPAGFPKTSERETNNQQPATRNPQPATNNPPGPTFDEFWAAYPNRRDRKAARRAWEKIKPTPELFAAMLAAIEREKCSDQWRRGIIPHAATWLNGERWEDDPPPTLAVVPTRSGGVTASERTADASRIAMQRAIEKEERMRAEGKL